MCEKYWTLPTPPGRPLVLDQQHVFLIQNIMDKQSDITLGELAERLENVVCISKLHNYLKKLGYGYKKKHSKHQSKIEKT